MFILLLICLVRPIFVCTYKLIPYKNKHIHEKIQIAVFGIGLFDLKKGEQDFLPVIGENNLAAMPYDIILQGNKATMLHGKYRIALYWPELTMGTFMKIMSTPKNIKRFMEGVTN